jgi:hypothetical protein
MIKVRVSWRSLYNLHSQICDKKSALLNAKYLKINRGNERKQIYYVTKKHQNA